MPRDEVSATLRRYMTEGDGPGTTNEGPVIAEDVELPHGRVGSIWTVHTVASTSYRVRGVTGPWSEDYASKDEALDALLGTERT